jgi:gliding motility-associated transport system ATP-binding protein
VIEVKGLTKRYGEQFAIRDLSFSVEQGGILGFLGPNGAGKTTTMRILTCYFPPSEGVARIAGFDVFAQSLEVRRRVGYLPENPPLYTEMNVRSYLKFSAKIKDVPARDVKKRVDAVVGQCHLEKVENRLIGQLSKGYRQRVGLAQALVHDPPVLILDEPTSGLDPAQIIEVRQLIRGLSDRHTVILSTHILPEVSQICRNVIIINDGTIVAQGTPENLVQDVGANRILELKIRGNPDEIRRRIAEVAGVEDVLFHPERSNGLGAFTVETKPEADPREDLARSLVQGGFGLAELSSRGVSLEDIYLRVIGGTPASTGPAGDDAAAAPPTAAGEANA